MSQRRTMLRRTAPLAAFLGVVALLSVLGALAGSGSRVQALTNCDTAEADITPPEQQMLSLINDARASSGLAPLKLSPNLNRAAAWKSADSSAMGAGFSHTDSLGRDPISAPPRNRPRDCGYAGGAAENIAYGSTNPQTIFNMWMQSAGHRGNINGTNLDGSINANWYQYARGYVVIGIGQHGTAWTTDFGTIDDSGSPAPTPAPPTPAPATPSAATSAPTAASTPTRPATATATATPTPSPTPRAPVSGVQIALSTGFNLVTYTGQPEPVAYSLGALLGAVVNVYEWDDTLGLWRRFAPGLPAYVDTFTIMQPGRVYYIEMGMPGIWTY